MFNSNNNKGNKYSLIVGNTYFNQLMSCENDIKNESLYYFFSDKKYESFKH